MPFGDRNFDFGVNMAWLNGSTGHDLGPNPYFSGPSPDHPDHPDWGICWSEELVRAYFTDLSAKGLKVVRVWAFEKLEGLQFNPDGFSPPGLVATGGSRARHGVITRRFPAYLMLNNPSVNGLDSDFQQNVQRLMELAQEAGLNIYWAILSGGNYFKNPDGHHQWALKRMLENSSYRRLFIYHALLPFLEILQPFQANVYAIDLINEPEGFAYDIHIAPIYPILRYPRDRLEDYVLEYIEEATSAIRDRDEFSEFKISVGFRGRGTIIDNLTALSSKLDFFDFHHYDESDLDDDLIPIPIDDKPTILGEVGFMSWLGNFTPNDREQATAADGIIGEAISRGFKGCLLWMYTPHRSDDDTNNLLLHSLGHVRCAGREGRDYIIGFNANSDDYWRTPIREVIARRRVEIDIINRGP